MLTIWKYNALSHIHTIHSNLISNGLNKALHLDIQITRQEEKKMDLTLESIEEFRTTERSLLLDDMELASLKSEVEAEVSLSKKSNKRGRRASDNPCISASPAKKKKGEPGNTDISISPVKRKAAPQVSHTSTPPMKKAKDVCQGHSTHDAPSELRTRKSS